MILLRVILERIRVKTETEISDEHAGFLHLIDLLAKLYRKQLAKVKVAGTLSEWFPVKKGVQQGCVLSLYLLNILAEMVMRETLDGSQGGLQIGGRMITNLHYADDIILLATSEAELDSV